MQVKEGHWFGSMKVSGSSTVYSAEGTVMKILTQHLMQLTSAPIRDLENGKEIIIKIRGDQMVEFKKESEQAKALNEATELIEPTKDLTVPQDDESYEQFYDRLIAIGCNQITAEFTANDWFDRSQNPRLRAWLNDSQAAHFRRLNTNNSAFESALPGEYDAVKTYVTQIYPEFLLGVTFRTA